jgi:hypothetical protein
MPLSDHFRSPVNDTHSWDEVHGQWPGGVAPRRLKKREDASNGGSRPAHSLSGVASY